MILETFVGLIMIAFFIGLPLTVFFVLDDIHHDRKSWLTYFLNLDD